MHLTTIQFPDIQLAQRDGHKLRGYFAELFRDRSTLLHNHFADGSSIYRYPLVQYKIIRQVPTLVGLAEGARLLVDLFLEIKEIKINDAVFPVHAKNINSKTYEIGVDGQLHEYEFLTPWLALNQRNYPVYQRMSPEEQKQRLNQLLCNHMLAMFKGVEYFESERLLCTCWVREIPVQFKGQAMKGFLGRFTANALLPDFIGIGKSVSRGFGTLQLNT